MLDNALNSLGVSVKEPTIWKRINWAWQQVIVVTVLLVGGCVLFYFFDRGFWHSIAEALFIAGLLTIGVDPFLKRKLQEDAAKDIFHHLLGFALPEAIREDLKEFVESNHCYRENTHISADAQIVDGRVKLRVAISEDVVAAKNTKYGQHLAFEESFDPCELEVSLTRHDSEDEREPEIPPLEWSTQEPMILEWTGEKIELRKGDKLHSQIKYTVYGSLKDFYVIFFEYAAINPQVQVTCGPGLQISASKAGRAGGQYFYNKVFRKADHIQIRWRPKSMLPSS